MFADGGVRRKRLKEKNSPRKEDFRKKSSLAVVKIEKIGGEGMAVARLNGKAVLVPFAVPGDEVQIELVKETSSYSVGRIKKIISPSQYRVSPPCPKFGNCGGCSHQNISYEAQLLFKKALLEEIYRKFTRCEKNGKHLEIEAIVPSPEQLGYRNKLQMQCGYGKKRKLVAGFYRTGTHDMVAVDYCLLHSSGVNKLVASVVDCLNEFGIPPYDEKTGRGIVRHIVVRESRKTGDMLLTLVTTVPTLPNQNALSKQLFSRNEKLAGFFLFHNERDTNVIFDAATEAGISSSRSPLRKIYGSETIVDSILGVDLRLSPLSFFQVNTLQASKLAGHVAEELLRNGEMSGVTGKKKGLIDLYSGIGALSLPVAGAFEEVMAIEIVEHACSLAKINARSIPVKNYRVRRGDAAEILEKLVRRETLTKFREKYPYLILDPPRSGLSEEITALICDAGFEKIIYVSCNPHTHARDLERFVNRGYEIVRLVPFDMFPQTFHIECVATLCFRGLN